MTDVSVTIVNHENRAAVLESLAGLDGAAEVIVVDNASQDGSVGAIRNAHPDVKVIARDHRAGYGANQNVGLREARGGYVLLLNDDARVEPGAIAALARKLDEDPRVAVVAPLVLSRAGVPERTLWPRPSLRADIAALSGRTTTPESIGWATGCALMVRRDAVLAVGGFDEDFFMYSEEIDLCTRLIAAGHRIAHVAEAVVVHEGQRSTGAGSPERAVEMARSRRRYWRKHYSGPERAAARVVMAALFALAAVRQRPAKPLLLQAEICVWDRGRPALREQAESFNRHRSGGNV